MASKVDIFKEMLGQFPAVLVESFYLSLWYLEQMFSRGCQLCDETIYFKSKHDLFQTPTKRFYCLNLTRPKHSHIHPKIEN